MKKCSLFIVIALIVSIISTLPAGAVSFTPNKEIYSEAAYLVNLDTGITIYEKNADKQEYPASLTKIMTAILVLENVPDIDNTMITAPGYLFDELYKTGASTADFRPNETASAKDLMYGMILQSACEAASILADYVGKGNMANFVQMMNDKAKEIGATSTHFANPHGLFDANQYTTARDMAKITEYAMKLSKFSEIANTTSYTIGTSNKHSATRTISHTNIMLDKAKGGEYYYPYAKGIKTGTLDESGRCLVSTASKNGYNYLLVTLHAPLKDAEGKDKFYNYTDAITLYDWAFSYFKSTNILTTDEEIAEVPVKFSSGNDYVLVSPSDDFSTLWPTTLDFSSVQRVVNLEKDVVAPVKKGAKLGTIELKLSGETLATVDLIAKDNVERSDLEYNLNIAKQFTSSAWFKTAIGVIILLIVLYIIFYITVTRKKRRKNKRVNKKRRF
mgnify:CR=1 FL=1